MARQARRVPLPFVRRCRRRIVAQVDSISVDWDVAAAAVRTRHGLPDLETRTAHRVVTTGCGQGTVYGDLMQRIDA